MIPIELLLRPYVLFQNYPIRNWRKVTMWLKWGLLFSLVAALVRVALSGNFSETSFIFWIFGKLNASDASFQLPLPVQFAFFLVFLCVLVVLSWMVKSAILYSAYQMCEGQFMEGRVALSIAGASMVANLWALLPLVGPYLGFIHASFLGYYLILRVNRIDLLKAMAIGVIMGAIPLVY